MTKTNGSFLIGSQPIQLDPDGSIWYDPTVWS